MPATLIASVFGQSFLKKEKSYPTYVKILFYSYVLIFLFSIICITLNIELSGLNNLSILVISLSGLLYYLSQTFRQISIIKSHTRNLLFLRDIIFSLLTIFILLIFILYLNDTYFVSFILVCSTLSFVTYLKFYNPNFTYKKNANKKINFTEI